MESRKLASSLSKNILNTKYTTSKDDYNVVQINLILKQKNCRVLSSFKDQMQWNKNIEFLRRYYCLSESIARLVKIIDFYTYNYQLYPNYFRHSQKRILDKYKKSQENRYNISSLMSLNGQRLVLQGNELLKTSKLNSRTNIIDQRLDIHEDPLLNHYKDKEVVDNIDISEISINTYNKFEYGFRELSFVNSIKSMIYDITKSKTSCKQKIYNLNNLTNINYKNFNIDKLISIIKVQSPKVTNSHRSNQSRDNTIGSAYIKGIKKSMIDKRESKIIGVSDTNPNSKNTSKNKNYEYKKSNNCRDGVKIQKQTYQLFNSYSKKTGRTKVGLESKNKIKSKTNIVSDSLSDIISREYNLTMINSNRESCKYNKNSKNVYHTKSKIINLKKNPFSVERKMSLLSKEKNPPKPVILKEKTQLNTIQDYKSLLIRSRLKSNVWNKETPAGKTPNKKNSDNFNHADSKKNTISTIIIREIQNRSSKNESKTLENESTSMNVNRSLYKKNREYNSTINSLNKERKFCKAIYRESINTEKLNKCVKQILLDKSKSKRKFYNCL